MATDQDKTECCGTGCCTPDSATPGAPVGKDGLPIVPPKTDAELEAELALVDGEASGSIIN